jgi:pSer/pThr/pTyr-binding forkhead associated (FHA) protein
MEDRPPSTQNLIVPFPRLERLSTSPNEMPPGFVPLRLVLLPSGVTLELDLPDMTLGRHSGVDLRLPLPDVSRRHCRFIWSGGTWSVSDLSSLNGVYINDYPMQYSELAQNDLVRIGGFTFAVDLNYPDPPKVVTTTASRLQSVLRAVQRAPQMTRGRLAS